MSKKTELLAQKTMKGYMETMTDFFLEIENFQKGMKEIKMNEKQTDLFAALVENWTEFSETLQVDNMTESKIEPKEGLNVKGLKHLLRNAREELYIKFYDADTYRNIVKMTVKELMQICKYDTLMVNGIEGQFWMDDDMKSPEDVLKGYVLNVGIFTEKTCEDGFVTLGQLDNLYEDYTSCEFGLMHQRFVEQIENIQRYDDEEQEDIITRLNEYQNLPADELKINFDEEDMFELLEEYGEDFEETEEYHELMCVEITPVLPEGMILFY